MTCLFNPFFKAKSCMFALFVDSCVHFVSKLDLLKFDSHVFDLIKRQFAQLGLRTAF